MLDFKQKRLYPLLKQFVEKIDSALPVNTPDQALGLLAVKKEAGERFRKLAHGQGVKAASTFVTTLAITGGLIAAAFLAPTVAIAASVAAGVTLVGGGLMAQKCALNKGEVTRDRFILSDKIDTEVAVAMTRMGNFAAASDIRQALGQAFQDAADKKEYDSLAKRALKFVAKAPKPVAVPIAASK